MDAFNYAVRKIMNSDIPDMILDDAFNTIKMRQQRLLRSIESSIITEVIQKRVMPDLNTLGGVSVDLNLTGLPYEMLSNYERIYRIPLHLTQNRPINQVLNVTLNVTSNFAERQPGQTNNTTFVTPIERSAQRVVNSWRPVPNITNAQVELLGDSVLKIKDFQNFSTDMTLRCLVSYSDEFTELKKPYYEDFGSLCLWATKSYIYRNLSLQVDMAKLSGGREFGRYKEFVDDYRDAYETYQTQLNEKWTRILLLNDQNRKDSHILRAGHTRA